MLNYKVQAYSSWPPLSLSIRDRPRTRVWLSPHTRSLTPSTPPRATSQVPLVHASAGFPAASSSASSRTRTKPWLPVSLGTAEFEKVEQCLVYRPTGTPTAVINFVGGSFIGAAPDLFYSYLIKLLVQQQFLVMATVYDVSFDHHRTAASVQARFQKCWETLNEGGLGASGTGVGLAPGDVQNLPVFGVGHSLGALMLALIGARDDVMVSPGAPKGHVIISYTNKPVASFASNLDRIGPTVSQLTSSLQSALAVAPGIVLAGLEQVLETAQRAELQLPSIFPDEQLDPFLRFYGSFSPATSDMTNGISEYFPSPRENLDAIAARYAVPANLLIQCEEDPVEDSPLLEVALRQRADNFPDSGVRVTRVVVPGTHFTPVAPEVDWRVEGVFTPVDAVAVAAKSAFLVDIRAMARDTGDWIRAES